MNESTDVKECGFNKLDIHEIDYLLEDIIKDCRSKYFHSFEYRLVYDIKFTNNISNQEINFKITHGSME